MDSSSTCNYNGQYVARSFCCGKLFVVSNLISGWPIINKYWYTYILLNTPYATRRVEFAFLDSLLIMRTLLTNVWQIILLKKIPFTIGKIGHILISISLLFLGINYVCENFICHQMQLFCDEGYYCYLWRGVIPILNKKLITWSNLFC